MSIYRDRSPEMREEFLKGLEEIADILDEHSFSWMLTCGALLGIYRQGELMSYDPDIDIDIKMEDFKRRHEVIEALRKKGFRVDVWDVKRVFRGKKYGHFYAFRFWSLKGKERKRRGGYTLPNKFFETGTIKFRGREYPCPGDIEGYLEYVYGKNWRIPYKVKEHFSECYTKQYYVHGQLQE